MIGASTWAFGSHRWRLYSDIFTIKAIMHASHRRVVFQEVGSGFSQYCISRKFSEPVRFWTWTSAMSSGMDPTRV